jgi:cardiolipin synthase
MLRIVLIPLFLYLLSLRTKNSMIWALVVFALASITDMLDGWSAKKLNQITDLGKFLDPLADKLLVISTFIAFLYLDPLIPFWMIIVIVSRDLLITLMRYLAIRKGTTLRTSRFGKIKTFFQMVSIAIILMVFIVRHSGMDYSPHPFGDNPGFGAVYDIYNSDRDNRLLLIAPYCLMAIVTFMTAFSGFRYLFTNWRLFIPPYRDVRKV